jgi:NAD(P)-dependent dehydrogenase (short-subunit alcohol dehydrogenase family)
MTTIDGSVAVVTGGASGIGRGIAEQLISEGATVVIADIDAAAVAQTAKEIGAVGVQVDVSDAVAVEALAQEAMRLHGRVDIVVNNAGVGPEGRFERLTLADWQWIMGVNFFGVVNGVQAFLPLLKLNATGGHIVNTASMSVFFDFPGLGAYTASKQAVVGLSRVLAAELAQDESQIHVSVLPPGPVRTNIANSLRHRTDGQTGGLADVDLQQNDGADDLRWIDPIDAGKIVTRAIRNNDFWALTHPEWWPMVDERNKADQAAFAKYLPGNGLPSDTLPNAAVS